MCSMSQTLPNPFDAEIGQQARLDDIGFYKLIHESETHRLFRHVSGTLFLFEKNVYNDTLVAFWTEVGDIKIEKMLRDVGGTFYPTMDVAESIVEGQDTITGIENVESLGETGMIIELNGLKYGDDNAVIKLTN